MLTKSFDPVNIYHEMKTLNKARREKNKMHCFETSFILKLQVFIRLTRGGHDGETLAKISSNKKMLPHANACFHVNEKQA